ncbi:hypothetical protein [Pedobacter nutrimenti]|uniref:hypothetical protein n=1 Tax=Pedobacter nutrimenti TaxID=1241337 RepID=UPI00293122D7|nr:hypothetical protein [Pedobacter nutrimenti]
MKPENIELSDKIMAGIHKAVHALVVNSAKKNEHLVIADNEGKVKSVPAKELLKTLNK